MLGAQFSIPGALFVRQPSADHESGAGNRLSLLRHTSGLKTGYSKKTARTGAVTLIWWFGSTFNLNINFHMLFLDGVYLDGARDGSMFILSH